MSPGHDKDAIVVDEGHETLAAAAAALVEAAERAPSPDVWEEALGGEAVENVPHGDGLVHSALAELRALAETDADDADDEPSDATP
ncbi:MAG TPA: hypothetical protein VFZ83_15295 [Acidimicrobiia bacterium]|nr:hypothetical protein [Acidimicrobiia bacterium]